MAEQKRDYYEVLGVDRSADDATIKKAYRQLAKNIIRMQTRETKRQKQNSKRLRRHMQY